ncbi:MAG TPA: NAD(P) transhydrogenase subunit alpha [Chitinophagaceae bacterium]
MIVGILKEPSFDNRVSLLAESATVLIKKGITVWTEHNAGENAFCFNKEYEEAGAVIKSPAEILSNADIVLVINPLSAEKLGRSDQILIGVYQPLFNSKLVQQYASQKCSIFSLDMLPRTTRAQNMDVLSSQANIAGYKAVLLASNLYPRYYPMLMTAAGSIKPAKVLILGAGVAGLQAIATAKRLGAVVEVFDTRPAVKEEVMSLGAKFIEVEGAADASKAGGYAVEQSEEYKKRQQEKIADSISKADVVITTAQIPGKKAPILITEEMLAVMRKGSVVIDIAAATGGNTPVTKNNEIIDFNGIIIAGNSNLPSSMPNDASRMYGKNILNFLPLIINKENKIDLNWNDELVSGACIVHDGEIRNEKVKSLL